MNENRNIVWIAVIGVAVLILVAMLLFRPQGEGSAPTSAPESGAPSSAFPNDPPLALAVPVLPPLPTAAPPDAPAPSDPAPAQPDAPPR